MYVALIGLLLTPKQASATAQEHEILWLNGVEHSMISTPLAPWLDRHPDAIPYYGVTRTSRWRGYLGVWEVKARQLYLRDLLVLSPAEDPTSLDARRNSDTSVLSQVFPNLQRVWAHWYTGFLIVPRGKMKKYVHMGFGSLYPRYHLLEIESGSVVSQKVMKGAEFELFRRSQFEHYRQTDEFKEILAHNMARSEETAAQLESSQLPEDVKESLIPAAKKVSREERAIEHLYQALTHYLSMRFEEN